MAEQINNSPIGEGSLSPEGYGNSPDCASHGSASCVNVHRIRFMRDFMREYNVTIPASKLRNWRLLYPHVGELDGFPHFGRVMILATDGIEAFYHVDCVPGCLFKGHLKAFNGPIGKDEIHEDDWDYERRKRKVRVFKRYEGKEVRTIIIPQDTIMDEYWEKHTRLDKDEKDVLERIGQRLVRVADYEKTLEQLRESRARVAKVKVKSKMQKILDML